MDHQKKPSGRKNSNWTSMCVASRLVQRISGIRYSRYWPQSKNLLKSLTMSSGFKNKSLTKKLHCLLKSFPKSLFSLNTISYLSNPLDPSRYHIIKQLKPVNISKKLILKGPQKSIQVNTSNILILRGLQKFMMRMIQQLC